MNRQLLSPCISDLEDWPDVVMDEDLNVLDARQILREREEAAREKDLAEGIAAVAGADVPVGPLTGEHPIGTHHIDNMVSTCTVKPVK
jgi:hypothetical protein